MARYVAGAGRRGKRGLARGCAEGKFAPCAAVDQVFQQSWTERLRRGEYGIAQWSG
jgi:hypothetical protein